MTNSEDTTVVEAALAFIDEFEAELDAENDVDRTSDSNESSDSTGVFNGIDATAVSINNSQDERKKMNVKRPRRNQWRDHQKQEILRLRLEVSELEQRVRELQQQKLVPNTMSYILPSSSRNGMAIEFSSVWKDLVARHYRARRAAETENTKLREQLAQEMKVAKTLHRLLLRRRVLAEKRLASPFNRGSKFKGDGMNPSISSSVFAELESRLAVMYIDTENALIASDMYNQTPPFSNCTIYQVSPIQTKVEVTCSGIIPFSFLDVGAAIWNQCRTNSFSYQCQVDATGNTMYRKYALVEQSGDVTLNVRGSGSFRKYMEKDRIVIVSIGQAEPVAIDHKPVDAICMNKKLWFVLQKEPNAVEEICVFRFCALYTIDAATKTPSMDRYVKIMIAYVTHMMQGGVQAKLEKIESSLLRRQVNSI